ncbi:hypothetical protein TSOC_002305 [Tetrabaena socialis]|uniref:Uncharacterized protein n=1 Tax=Tetrabaena socialis TaxID=47790 RepID=A0A2J8AEH8_9CHLO|nr:hypothetical protein TSOC_002305 [Tetrabaena socialis]|eukprot:PNH10927.1 hypothetical protein TSOC_002305 [Tetrabaena socialis]
MAAMAAAAGLASLAAVGQGRVKLTVSRINGRLGLGGEGEHKGYTSPDEVFADVDYMLALRKRQRAKDARVVSGFKPGDRVQLLEGKGLFDKEKATYSQQIYTVTWQEGFRFAVEGKRRLYRPSEMLLVREVTDRVAGGAWWGEATGRGRVGAAPGAAQGSSPLVRRVARALAATQQQATRAIEEPPATPAPAKKPAGKRGGNRKGKREQPGLTQLGTLVQTLSPQ